MQHDLINTGDPDSHSAIEDGHGCVVLAQCRVCKQAEGDLAEECPGARHPETAKALVKVAATRKKHPKITMGTVAAILGMSQSLKRDTVLRDMVREYHGAPSEYVANVAAEYNDDNRATAMQQFENRFKMIPRMADPKKQHKIMNVHPTLIDSEKRGSTGLLFVRTPFGQRSAVSKDGFKTLEYQPHMFAQMQIEMHLSGLSWGIFYQWAPLADTFELVELEPGFIEGVLPQLESFYEHYKAETKNPLHLEPPRKIIDNEKYRKLLDEYDELLVAQTNAEARMAEIKEVLVHASMDRSSIICGRMVTRTESKGSISYATAIKKLLPSADLEPYRGKPSVKWTLT